MAVGDSSNLGGLSYIAVGRETNGSYGTYNTCTAGLHFLSSSLKVTQEPKILEQIQTSRTFTDHVRMGKVISGDIEFYFKPEVTAHNYFLENGFGAAPTSATATGETAGGSAFSHTYLIGDVDDASYSSLCINMRKGHTSTGQVFEYSGLKVDSLSFEAEIDEPLKCSVSMLGKDATLTTNDVSSALTLTCEQPLNFSSGRLSVESSFASLTSTSFWHVQSMSFSLSNSLKGDAESRRIGSDTLALLPQGMATFELSATIRFDTTTAFDAMVGNTQLSLECEFLADTLSTSVIRRGIKMQFPRVYVMDSGDPEVGGPDEILTSEVTFAVLRDCTSDTGYAVRAIVTNDTSSYA